MVQDLCGRTIADLCVVRGDNPTFELTLDDGATSPSPIDLTGATVALSVNSEQNPEAAPDTELFSIVGTITDAPNGIVQFTVLAANSVQVPAVYYYDIEVVFPGSVKRTVVVGKWTVESDITDPGA